MRFILGLLFAIVLAGVAIRPYLADQAQFQQNVRASATAGEARQILTAAQKYIQTYYPNVEAVATPNKPATITVGMLESTGLLSTAFGASNPWAQTWQVQVLQPSPGKLQALLLSEGGVKIPERVAPEIATEVGASGGFVPYSGEYGNLGPNIAQGAYGHWSVSMAGYSNPGPGHVAALLAFDNGSLETDYLYRVQVPGHPQLNTMQTALNMGSNAITNAGNVSAANGAIALGTAGATTCNANARLHLAGSQVWDGCDGDLHLYPSGGNGASVVTGANIWAGNSITANANLNVGGSASVNGNVNAGGSVVGGYVASRGNVQANGSFTTNGQIYFNGQWVAPGWGCGEDGELMGSTYNGGDMLVCHNGAWQSAGSAGPEVLDITSGPHGNSTYVPPPACPGGYTLVNSVPVSDYAWWSTISICKP